MSAARPPGGEPGSVASFRAACGHRTPTSGRAPRAALGAGPGAESMGSDRSAPGRRAWAGSVLGGREEAARPRLLPLLLVLLGCLGRDAAAEDAEVNAEVRTPALSLCLGLGDLAGAGVGGYRRSHARSLRPGGTGRGDEPPIPGEGVGRKGPGKLPLPSLLSAAHLFPNPGGRRARAHSTSPALSWALIRPSRRLGTASAAPSPCSPPSLSPGRLIPREPCGRGDVLSEWAVG